ncbi:SAM-dependent methyltransferase [Massilia soli]|uniref:SAM-dependent methyltransferase n=1 Tax=Massilia soli TaxID=2792854 RepID=A0ABS7SMI8_9BURK|nr:SAM-dependent methyltransferase [Massilia soli]MBZ2207076.1 SAM-dependent methyltransferase [Massilia soli]
MLIITIKQGKEKSILAGEPWIYASAIERVEGRNSEKMKPGATAIVQSSARTFLARAAYNSRSQIRARVWTLDEAQPIDHALIKRRVKLALEKSAAAAAKAKPGTVVRRVNAEADGLPGLLVDGYGGKDGYLICEFQAGGVDAWKVPIVQALLAETGCRNVWERADDLVRKGEGLPVTSGALAGDAPPDEIIVNEEGVQFSLDLKTGHKSRFR